MYRKQVNEHSPIRILEESIHGGLGKGNLGVVMSRAGVGKTAALIQIALDDLLRERAVLHVAIDQTIEHVQSWYDALFADLSDRTDLQEAHKVAEMIAEKRLIVSFMDHDLWPERLKQTGELFKNTRSLEPAVILVDGYPWSMHSETENAAMIGAFKSYAKMMDAELWMSAQTHRDSSGDHPSALCPPCDNYNHLIDVAIFLEPHGSSVRVRLLKDHDNPSVPDTHLRLHPDTMSLVSDEESSRRAIATNSAFTLLSGGAKGAEAMFGQCAEQWGLGELNFTFDGRTPARTRGLVKLSHAELDEGTVSPAYVHAQMHRSYPDSAVFKKTLASIWHQVNTAGEVFSIGSILDDKTVKGGTGWAAELARHWHKPVHVFDQDKNAWFRWDGEDWAPEEQPVIRERRFAGTGTRELNDHGAAAIRGLFQAAFGDPPAWPKPGN